MSDYKDFICAVPFDGIEVHDFRSFLCCPSWLTKHLPKGMSARESFNSDVAKNIRESVIDGSYKYCDKQQCPFLLAIPKGVKEHRPLYKKGFLPDEVQEKVDKHKKGIEFSPRTIQFSFDRSCNLACPSCRIDMFIADSKKIKTVKATIQEIEDDYASTVKVIYITGSGDPFISVGFRDYLRNFDASKYPKLESIHLHTNATYWDKKMWDSMPNIHRFVKSCEISIDAGTKDTYENKTRINGKWDELIDNLNFISTIRTLNSVKTSFVVQNHNYMEMKIFYDSMMAIFKKKTKVFYGKINNWGTFTPQEFDKHNVWDETHKNHKEFIKHANEFLPAPQTFHNLHEFIEEKTTLI